MLYILGFLAILGPLVVVHEFGHYLFAKLFNVKAEAFSIGFGPKLFARTWKETEWRVSAIPLGGYVKLLGEDRDAEISAEDLPRALNRQAAWKRFFIFFGGPLFNFLFAVVIFMMIFVIGEQVPASVIGRVVKGSAAEKAGFRNGDIVVAVEGKEITRFDELLYKAADKPEQPLQVTIRRAGSPATAQETLTVTPSSQPGFNVYGELTRVGEIDGLFSTPRATDIGVSSPKSAAAQAGLLTGDKIIEVNGQKLETWEDFESQYEKAAPGANFKIVALREDAGKKAQRLGAQFVKTPNKTSLSDDWGLHSSELFVEKVVPKSPAEGLGLQGADRLVRVGGREVRSFFELKDAIQQSGEKSGKVVVQWERKGDLMTREVEPTAKSSRDPLLNKTTQYTIGVIPMLTWAQPVLVTERILNPFVLVYKSTERMVILTYRNFESIRKMFAGSVSMSTIGGPIMIGKVAGESLARGLISFLTMMAILSVGLGVLNILPIPVLDGGHLVLLGLEAIRGKPLSIRQMEIVQQVGLSLILLLMVVVLKNDILRLPFFSN